jgi:5-methylcytosine-specific restriction enzyme subunit McrC
MDHTSELRTHVLTERRAAVCRLSRADVDFLLAEHRTTLDLVPTGRRGHYRLAPTHYVGVVVCPECRLVIRPKLPLSNLFNLLDPVGPLPTSDDRTTPLPGTDGLDFLAGRLAQMLHERAAAGLHRAYAERAESGRFLQGRIDLTAQLREAKGRKDQLHCQYEDFTADVPCNQLPKATAELVLRSPLLADGVRATLSQALIPYAVVSSVAIGPESFSTVSLDRLTEAYGPLFDLCRLLVESLRPGQVAGGTACPAFLLDMERVFECYCARGLAEALAKDGRIEVAVQALFTVSQPVTGQPDLTMRPDLTLNNDGQPVLVLDTKWKRLVHSPLITEDIYQMLAYCAALGVDCGTLLYPGRRDRAWEYQLARPATRLVVRTLRVMGSRQACTRSVAQLAKSLRRVARR